MCDAGQTEVERDRKSRHNVSTDNQTDEIGQRESAERPIVRESEFELVPIV